MELDLCTHQDFLDILADLEDFWGSASERARRVHHPMFVHEFGDTAWVVREDGRVIAYLFAFWSQTEPTGYIHLVAVRRDHQGRGIGRWLYEQFEARARARGCSKLKALTAPVNTESIAFHRRLGFTLLGEPNEEDVPVVSDYLGPGEPRVVFEKHLD
jgi:GNAT superfamily N-acetyltransferase